MAKMKQRLPTYVWWPGNDREAETFCKTCYGYGCQVVGGPSNPESLHMTELPQGRWQSITIYFMGPLTSGDCVFAVTDYYSLYTELSISIKNTADVAISSIEKMPRLW